LAYLPVKPSQDNQYRAVIAYAWREGLIDPENTFKT
jgi:hypothetical protein